jgi:predicted type IV restriction endonuclease
VKEQIRNFVISIKQNIALRTADEAAIKQAIILPLLRLLKWDDTNINEVFPEFSVEGKRVDYALRVNGTSEFFIEVKRPSEDLEAHQEQLLEYSFRQGVELAALTNGFTWFFYLPTRKGDWSTRRFYAIDIDAQDPDNVADNFIAILSKSNVTDGQALQYAEATYKGRIQKQKVEETLPEAWKKIISDPEPRLMDLIVEITEKMCGSRPTAQQVGDFLKSNMHTTLFLNLASAKASSPKSEQKKCLSPSAARHTNQGRRPTIHPTEIRIGDFHAPVRNWNEIPIVVANWILAQGKPLREIPYFVHKTNSGFQKAAQIKELNNGWFIEIGDNWQVLIRKGRKLLDVCGMRDVRFRVFREDGTVENG